MNHAYSTVLNVYQSKAGLMTAVSHCCLSSEDDRHSDCERLTAVKGKGKGSGFIYCLY